MKRTNGPAPLPRTPLLAPDGTRFTWGPIQQIHTIGRYQIVEYLEDLSNCGQPETWERHGQPSWHPYVEGFDTHQSFGSLESAMVGVVAFVREGPNSQAARYFNRMTRSS